MRIKLECVERAKEAIKKRTGGKLYYEPVMTPFPATVRNNPASYNPHDTGFSAQSAKSASKRGKKVKLSLVGGTDV